MLRNWISETSVYYGESGGSSPDSGHSQSQRQPLKILDPYGSTPRLEISERGSTMDLSKKSARLYQNYKVRQAKHLSSKWSATPCPYVKVSLYPANAHKTRCKTSTYLDTTRPQFDEKFSFEIGEEDFNRRLLVSVWSKDPNNNHSELLGCMSFGINNIIRGRTTVHGWYFLLSESVGRHKHLQAHNKRHLVVDTDDWHCYQSETTSVSEFSLGPHQDIPPDSSVGRQGYGFTLTGGCPSHVFTIDPESPADSAGMRVGDAVLSINGQDVSRATADTVARIVRFHEVVAIEVQSPIIPTLSPVMPPWLSDMSKGRLPRARALPICDSQILKPLTELDLPGANNSSNSHTGIRHS
ncbi:hypothetical protein LSH36_159g06045 [Paralvinella palmiformis]|uniref:Uncharacterized protein n=1 Tax=Paralvinella palmiformis TaxID=53620 RepID=A0AAD9JTV8_9ANNE|nr:hypothetical protein LSH36_159g06045 [Paralvinella palmiformis]